MPMLIHHAAFGMQEAGSTSNACGDVTSDLDGARFHMHV